LEIEYTHLIPAPPCGDGFWALLGAGDGFSWFNKIYDSGRGVPGGKGKNVPFAAGL
jgi:hypothetical protein